MATLILCRYTLQNNYIVTVTLLDQAYLTSLMRVYNEIMIYSRSCLNECHFGVDNGIHIEVKSDSSLISWGNIISCLTHIRALEDIVSHCRM